MTRAQTSTEFLVLLSVSLLLVLIVVFLLVDLPRGATTYTQDASRRTNDQQVFGIAQYQYADDGVHIHVVNNNPVPATVFAIQINTTNQSVVDLPYTIRPGERKVFTWYDNPVLPDDFNDTVTLYYCVGGCLVNHTFTGAYAGRKATTFYRASIDTKESLFALLLNHLSFDDDSLDKSPYAHHASLDGGVSYVPGRFGRAIQLSDSGDAININESGTILDLTSDRDYSFVIWAKTDDDALILQFGKETIVSSVGIISTSNMTTNSIVSEIFKIDGINACSHTLSASDSALQPGAWIMYTFIIDKNGSVTQYINENQRGFSPMISCTPDANQHGNVTENPYVIQGDAFTYALDEFMLFNTSLTSHQVRSLYQRGRS